MKRDGVIGNKYKSKKPQSKLYEVNASTSISEPGKSSTNLTDGKLRGQQKRKHILQGIAHAGNDALEGRTFRHSEVRGGLSRGFN